LRSRVLLSSLGLPGASMSGRTDQNTALLRFAASIGSKIIGLANSADPSLTRNTHAEEFTTSSTPPTHQTTKRSRIRPRRKAHHNTQGKRTQHTRSFLKDMRAVLMKHNLRRLWHNCNFLPRDGQLASRIAVVTWHSGASLRENLDDFWS
jgi:hypothetical protein